MIYDRLSHVEFWWKLRCMRQAGRPTRRKVAENEEGWTTYEIELPAALADSSRFLQRIAHEPQYWAWLHRKMREGTGRQHRGKQYARRREALRHLWVQLLVKGAVTDVELAAVQCARTMKDTLKGHQGTPWKVLDVRRQALRQEHYDLRSPVHAPLALRGKPGKEELDEFFEHRMNGDEGLPASQILESLGNRTPRSHWAMEPDYLDDVLDFQAACIDQLRRMKVKGQDDANRKRLLTDFGISWWILARLHLYCFIDVALDWWSRQSRDRQKEALAKVFSDKLTARRAIGVVRAAGRRRPGLGRIYSPNSVVVQFIEAGVAYTHRHRADLESAREAFAAGASVKGADAAVRALAAFNAHELARMNSQPIVASRSRVRALKLSPADAVLRERLTKPSGEPRWAAIHRYPGLEEFYHAILH